MISPVDQPDSIQFIEQDDIVVFLGGEDEGVKQPDTFQCCPLGLQFYTRQPVSENQLMELQFALPRENDAPETVACTGLVAQCSRTTPESDLYRVWIAFLNLEKDIQERIQQLAVSQRLTCPFCQNF